MAARTSAAAAPRNALVAAGLVVFAGGMASFPFVYKQYVLKQNLNFADKPLAGQNIVRGAYINSGSKDIGVDPDWDPKTGTWRGRASLRERQEALASERAAAASGKGQAVPPPKS